MTLRCLAIVALLLATSHAAFAQSEPDSLPPDMLGFLKPGMRVGLQYVDGTTNVLLSIYTSDQLAVARDLAGLGRTGGDAALLANAHPVVRQQLDAYIGKLTQDSAVAKTDNIRVVPLSRALFGTVGGIGGDYVLIELDGEPKRRRILPKSAIGRIDLDAAPVRFFSSSRR